MSSTALSLSGSSPEEYREKTGQKVSLSCVDAGKNLLRDLTINRPLPLAKTISNRDYE